MIQGDSGLYQTVIYAIVLAAVGVGFLIRAKFSARP